jgi:hypothetical protein
MTRIITNNYIEKLNKLIIEFENSPNLYLLVDFFVKEVQTDQDRKANRNQKIFTKSDLLKIIEIKDLNDLKRLFSYINLILKTFNGQYLHIHINCDLSENIINNLTTLFAWEALVECSYDKETIDNQIGILKAETKRDLIMPSDNNGHETNQIFRKRYGSKHRLKFIEKIKSLAKSNSNNGLLLNLNSSTRVCVNLSDFSVFPDPLNTYVNFGDSLQDIYEKNNSILQNISTIISLFPAERGRNIWHSDYISENINAWNQLSEFNFNKVITITSGEKTPEGLLEMQKQKKFQSEEIYTIFSFEL